MHRLATPSRQHSRQGAGSKPSKSCTRSRPLPLPRHACFRQAEQAVAKHPESVSTVPSQSGAPSHAQTLSPHVQNNSLSARFVLGRHVARLHCPCQRPGHLPCPLCTPAKSCPVVCMPPRLSCHCCCCCCLLPDAGCTGPGTNPEHAGRQAGSKAGVTAIRVWMHTVCHAAACWLHAAAAPGTHPSARSPAPAVAPRSQHQASTGPEAWHPPCDVKTTFVRQRAKPSQPHGAGTDVLSAAPSRCSTLHPVEPTARRRPAAPPCCAVAAAVQTPPAGVAGRLDDAAASTIAASSQPACTRTTCSAVLITVRCVQHAAVWCLRARSHQWQPGTCRRARMSRLRHTYTGSELPWQGLDHLQSTPQGRRLCGRHLAASNCGASCCGAYCPCPSNDSKHACVATHRVCDVLVCAARSELIG